MSSFSRKESEYIHADSDAMTYNDAEAVLAGLGFGKNSKNAVFMINGQWTENEMDWMLAEQENIGKPQTLRAMRVPVASGIKNRTETINDEATLRSVIDYIDGNVAELPSGVSEKDLEIVSEARKMSSATLTGTTVIPKAAVNKEGAKEFLRFLASDAAQALTAEQFNGIPLLPFGYVPSEEKLSTASAFVKDYLDITKDRKFVSSNSQEHSFAWFGNFYFGATADNKVKEIFVSKNVKTADEYYTSLYTYYNSRWTTIVKDFREQKAR